MEWYEAVERLRPHVVRIHTPRGQGTGFLVGWSRSTDICGIATAAHVVKDADFWGEPIKLFHPDSGRWLCLDKSKGRGILLEEHVDTAVVVFSKGDFPLPEPPIELIAEGYVLKQGHEIGWLGFPAVSSDDLCFFCGNVSHWSYMYRRYLIDGVVIHGVSGGPAFTRGGDTFHLVGVVSHYIPNLVTGTPMPGLGVVQHVGQLHSSLKTLRSIEEAATKQVPPPPPPPSPSPPAPTG